MVFWIMTTCSYKYTSIHGVISQTTGKVISALVRIPNVAQ